MATLQVVKGPNVGHCYELTTDESVLGRYPFCEVVLPSHTVSRQHARIVREGSVFSIEDLNSLNGTFVNGDRVRQRTTLKNEDRIRIYEILLVFHSGKPGPLPPEPEELTPLLGRGTSQGMPADEDSQILTICAAEPQGKPAANRPDSQQMRRVFAAASGLLGVPSQAGLSQRILDAALELFPAATRVQLWLPNEAGVLGESGRKHRHEDAMASLTLAPNNRPALERVFQEAVAVVVGRPQPELDVDDSVLDAAERSTMYGPLVGPSRCVVGVLQVEATPAPQPFAGDDLDLLLSLGVVAGQAVEFARLEK